MVYFTHPQQSMGEVYFTHPQQSMGVQVYFTHPQQSMRGEVYFTHPKQSMGVQVCPTAKYSSTEVYANQNKTRTQTGQGVSSMRGVLYTEKAED